MQKAECFAQGYMLLTNVELPSGGHIFLLALMFFLIILIFPFPAWISFCSCWFSWQLAKLLGYCKSEGSCARQSSIGFQVPKLKLYSSP